MNTNNHPLSLLSRPLDEYPTAVYTDANGQSIPVFIHCSGMTSAFFYVIPRQPPYSLIHVHRNDLTNISMPNLLPHRFRESAFRKYEPIIADVIANWPKVLSVTPGGSPVTFTCRLRDAMASFVKNKWESKSIPQDDFSKIYPEIIVSERDGIVHIGSRDALKTFHTSQAPSTKDVVESSDVVPRLVLQDQSSLFALCELLSKRVITGPYRLEGYVISPEAQLDVESRFDVAFIEDEQTKGLIIT